MTDMEKLLKALEHQGDINTSQDTINEALMARIEWLSKSVSLLGFLTMFTLLTLIFLIVTR